MVPPGAVALNSIQRRVSRLPARARAAALAAACSCRPRMRMKLKRMRPCMQRMRFRHDTLPCAQILKLSVRDGADVRPYYPPPTLPAANLLYGEVAYVTDKVCLAGAELAKDCAMPPITASSARTCSLRLACGHAATPRRRQLPPFTLQRPSTVNYFTPPGGAARDRGQRPDRSPAQGLFGAGAAQRRVALAADCALQRGVLLVPAATRCHSHHKQRLRPRCTHRS